MTWVIGANSLFGHAFLVSDIRVTFTLADGEHSIKDCLQKVYPLGQFIAGGFAGSIRCGFQVLSGLSQLLSQAPEDTAWDLGLIANDWLPHDLKRLFEQCPEEEQQLGCQIILAGPHPTQNRGDAPWAFTEVFRFSWPNFEPEQAPVTGSISIGSGSGITVFCEAITGYTSQFHFHQAAMGGEHAQAGALAHHVTEVVQQAPEITVAPFFQVTSVTRGRITTINHEYTTYPQAGPPVEHRFPPIAQGYEAFLQMCGTEGVSATGAIA